MLYIKNSIPFTFGRVSTSIVKADYALHVMLHMNALKLITAEVLSMDLNHHLSICDGPTYLRRGGEMS